MIWGLTLEPGKDYTQLVQDEVHLSMATMESRGCIGSKDEKYSHVMMKTNTAEYMLCTLVSGITYQQGLDLKLMPSDEVTFTVQGTNTVYLTGYSYALMEVGDEQQPEDWIEEQSLDESFTNEPGEVFADDIDSYHAPTDQCTEQQLEEEEDISAANDEEKYSTSLEAEAELQLQQQQPIMGSPTSGTPVTQSEPGEMSSHSGASRQPETHSTDVLNVQIKTEIHPVVEIEQPTPDHPFVNEDDMEAGGQPPSLLTEVTTGGPPTNLPSTSRGQHPWQSLTQPHAYAELGNNYINARIEDPTAMYGLIQNIVQQAHSPHTHFTQPQWGNAPMNSYHRNWYIPRNVEPVRRNTTVAMTPGPRVRAKGSPRVPRNVPQAPAAGGPVGAMAFKCKFCAKMFSTPVNMKRHEGTHMADRPFSCRHCFKSFRTQDSVRKHERIHTGERPYTCDLCGKTFIQNSHLHVHLRKFHNKVAWKPKNLGLHDDKHM